MNAQRPESKARRGGPSLHEIGLAVTGAVAIGSLLAIGGLGGRPSPFGTDGDLAPQVVLAAGSALEGREILSRPTRDAITIRVIAGRALTAFARWGHEPGTLDRESSRVHMEAGPVDVRIEGLEPGTTYYYRLVVLPDDGATEEIGDEHAFRTAPLPGTPFTFVIQADPHLDDNSKPEVYRQALENALADGADFLVDLGDTAMSDKCTIEGARLCAPQRPTTYDQVVARNVLQRAYFEQVTHSLPLFMVLGNHEAEGGWADTGKSDSLFAWSIKARQYFYANPEPDGFYTGNEEVVPGLSGRRQNYYAWEWGDALFVVLDAFGYVEVKPNGYTDDSMWRWTLGAAQYRWLRDTLESSRARYKFVFSHNMVGGSGSDGRGGAAFADKFEWGGRNVDGSWGFDQRRPGWEKPIHQLLVDNHVSIWFHGHDHLYAAEQLDGVVYQEVPQPSLARYDTADPGGGYGYQGAVGDTVFPSSGHLRVSVAPEGVRVDYVRAVAPGDETETRRNGTLVHSYSLR